MYDLKDIDIERLRSDLIDYFTSAMFMVSPAALMDVSKVQNASGSQLITIAINSGFDLNRYVKWRKKNEKNNINYFGNWGYYVGSNRL